MLENFKKPNQSILIVLGNWLTIWEKWNLVYILNIKYCYVSNNRQKLSNRESEKVKIYYTSSSEDRTF